MISFIYDSYYKDYVTSYYPNNLTYPYRHTVYKKDMKDIKFDYWEYILTVNRKTSMFVSHCKTKREY